MKKHAFPIYINGLHKSFGKAHILQGIDLEIAPEESFVLLGRSGCGKSVLLKCLLGLLSIDRGVLQMEGASIPAEGRQQQFERMKKIGMVFQGSALFDSLSVWENVAFGLLMGRQQEREYARSVAIEKLTQVGLDAAIADQLPAELSGGMKRRVALARAIALSPAFLFLDEPTAGLDPPFSRLIGDLIQKFRKALGATTFTITHDLELARTIADRIGMIHKGKIIWQGPANTLPHVGHPIVREFIGGVTGYLSQ